MLYTIKFSNIGRDKWNGQVQFEYDSAKIDADIICDKALIEVKKHLISRFPDVDYNARINQGSVSAGYVTIGTFTIEPKITF